MIPFCRTRLRRPFDALGWLPSIGAEEHGQPRDRALVIFAFAAHVTDPRREVWHRDQLFTKPGKVGDVAQMHYARGTFIARELSTFGLMVWGRFDHGLGFGSMFVMADYFPFGWGPIDQHSFADNIFHGE